MKILAGLVLIISCAIKKPDIPQDNTQSDQRIDWKFHEDTDGDGIGDLLEYSLGFNPFEVEEDEYLTNSINLMAEKINTQSLKTNILKYFTGAFTTGELNTAYDIENLQDLLQYKPGTVDTSSEIYILLDPIVLIRPMQNTKIFERKFPIQKPPPQIPKVQCYFEYGQNERYYLEKGHRKTLPCDVSLAPPPSSPTIKPPCIVKTYFRPEEIWMPFKISQEKDIFNSLKLKVGDSFFSLKELEKNRKIKFHWIADYNPIEHYDGFSERLLIVIHDLSLIADIDGETQVEIISSVQSEKFYHGIRIEDPERNECLEFAKSIGNKYGLTLWKMDWGDDPSYEVKYYKIGDGFLKYQKDYAIRIHSIIKENL